MRYVYYNGVDILPDQLWDFAWSAPMRDLADKVGMSDVGLRKALRSYGVILPPQGHWNRVHAGRNVETRPKVPERRPGETGRIRVDSRLGHLFEPAEPISSGGPFVSAHVPENLEELRAQELRAIGRARVSKSLDAPNRGLNDLLLREQRRREKSEGRTYWWDAPKFDNPLSRRRLRILSGIFDALDKRGHSGSARDDNDEVQGSMQIGDMGLSLRFEIVGKHRSVRQAGRILPAPDLPASTALRISIVSDPRQSAIASWADDTEGLIESKIASIAASAIVAGEARFRRSLKDAEEERQRRREAEERKRKERLAALNEQRLVDLRTSGELLRRAQDIRLLVSEVKRAMDEGTSLRPQQTLEAWERWALAEADRIDPVKSGQVEKHLDEPSLPDELDGY